ncbi:hypothetical protein HUG10_17980 [Halorarum halophilum]|uniref:IclR helix-turn-helix domain-containing protein n=1 Tax=Halorarum halophilum TaxID=2743090 RepID=A0A7D5L2Z9_9EURY|nr:helix-turn-helix domain-containing protein [Halobaculum halophilum]QLG29303.1 hypothetical protein HUG10_17980 [Halobaculum halophilum]
MRHVALLLAVLCLLAPLTVVGASAATDGDAHDAPRPAVATPFEATETSFTISLQSDGDARWTVAVLYRFEDEEAQSAFETYAEEYESGDSSTGPSADVFRNAASVASNTTNREMSVRSVNRTAELRNETAGVLRLRFTWTDFLERRSTGEYVLGDVFVSGSEETWFRTLGAGQRVVIQPPPGYTTTNVSVGDARNRIVNRNIVISDPYTFADGDIAITYEPGSQPQPFWQDTQVLLGSAGLLVLLVTAVYIVSRRRNGVGRGHTEHGGTSKVLPPGDSPGEASALAASADGNDGGDGTGGGGSGANDPDEPAPEPAPELLSDEERVERLLDRNGGRMRQADIVKETGWSDAKVSQLLSTMAEDGEVEKLRLGRENLISLPDEEGEDGDPDGDDR